MENIFVKDCDTEILYPMSMCVFKKKPEESDPIFVEETVDLPLSVSYEFNKDWYDHDKEWTLLFKNKGACHRTDYEYKFHSKSVTYFNTPERILTTSKEVLDVNDPRGRYAFNIHNDFIFGSSVTHNFKINFTEDLSLAKLNNFQNLKDSSLSFHNLYELSVNINRQVNSKTFFRAIIEAENNLRKRLVRNKIVDFHIDPSFYERDPTLREIFYTLVVQQGNKKYVMTTGNLDDYMSIEQVCAYLNHSAVRQRFPFNLEYKPIGEDEIIRLHYNDNFNFSSDKYHTNFSNLKQFHKSAEIMQEGQAEKDVRLPFTVALANNEEIVFLVDQDFKYVPVWLNQSYDVPVCFRSPIKYMDPTEPLPFKYEWDEDTGTLEIIYDLDSTAAENFVMSKDWEIQLIEREGDTSHIIPQSDSKEPISKTITDNSLLYLSYYRKYLVEVYTPDGTKKEITNVGLSYLNSDFKFVEVNKPDNLQLDMFEIQ